MIEFEFLHDMSLTGSGDRPWQTGWSGIFVRNRSNLILNVSLVMVMVTVRVMQTQQCIYVLASIVVVSIVLDSTVVDSTVLASTNAEILGYIVRYWKILGPVICQFAFLAIRKFCQFCRIITPLAACRHSCGTINLQNSVVAANHYNDIRRQPETSDRDQASDITDIDRQIAIAERNTGGRNIGQKDSALTE